MKSRNTLWVVSYLRSADVKDIDQYPMGRFGSSACYWRSTKPNFRSNESVSTVNLEVDFGNANTGGVTKLFFQRR